MYIRSSFVSKFASCHVPSWTLLPSSFNYLMCSLSPTTQPSVPLFPLKIFSLSCPHLPSHLCFSPFSLTFLSPSYLRSLSPSPSLPLRLILPSGSPPSPPPAPWVLPSLITLYLIWCLQQLVLLDWKVWIWCFDVKDRKCVNLKFQVLAVLELLIIHYIRLYCYLPMIPHVRLLVGWSVGRSVEWLDGREDLVEVLCYVA